MKKIVAELIVLKNNFISPIVYCLNNNGIIDEAISMTLCDALWELRGEPLLQLHDLINKINLKTDLRPSKDLPEFSINDKLIRLISSPSTSCKILISNENIPEFSIDNGLAQCFTTEQFNAVTKFVLDFESLIAQGNGKVLANRISIDFPET